ncbi:MAG: PEP-CTERM sorting domain-containing protein [Candidatus Omnitrophica bacterium]|nr:PEP-CTERM sorting domain-containing protein [Candidatus Omnitrophota bacterium]
MCQRTRLHLVTLQISIQMTWAMECGNDLVECKVVPEPTTVALISCGVAAMAQRKRRRQV